MTAVKQPKTTVVTRFAPSPTGSFHLGNARTALYNFLYARSHRGKFILRIEDTDRQRSQKAFEKEIIDVLEWLGLKFDGEAIHQSERLAIYAKYVDDLKTSGTAYEHGGAVYFRASMFRDQMEAVEFNDLIRGKIATPTKTIDDFVIVKSDGTPLFLLTNIIDDVELGVTQVIRGEDHISNTPRQLMIALALNLTPPQYAHVPIILAPDRSKLSKRHGAVSVREYQAQGYLPEAMINFLAFLGWHPSEKVKSPASPAGRQKSKVKSQEFFTLAELIKDFSLERVQKSGAVFDLEKLNAINRYYLRKLPAEELVKKVAPFSAHQRDDPADLKKVASLVRDRLTRLVEFDSLTLYFFNEPNHDRRLLIFKDSDQSKTVKGLKLAISKLEISGLDKWQSTAKLQRLLADVVKEGGLSNGDVFWPVRVALSGQEHSPGPHELLWAMGKEQAIKRINKALQTLKAE